MSFCSSCGAQNSDDARFCNKCGTAIASAAAAPPSGGSTGNAPAPPAGPTTGTVTLGGIGIQSPGKTYAILGAGALVFLGLGAGIAWVGMHGGSAPPATTSDGSGETADGTGDAIPDGVDVPDDDFVMTSGARVVKRGASAPTTTTGGTPPSSGTSPPATTTGRTPPATRTTGGSHPPPTTTTTTTGSHTGTSPIDPPPTSTTGSGTTPPPSSGSPDWDTMSGTVADEEPDYEMQMYSTQVRRFIRQYLLPQATSCFEHASATSRDPVHGTVAIGFDINARGHAESATIDRNTTGNDALGRCLQNNVNSWQLPPPPEGSAPLQMQMPFTR